MQCRLHPAGVPEYHKLEKNSAAHTYFDTDVVIYKGASPDNGSLHPSMSRMNDEEKSDFALND
jgi:hypothetical protein